MERCIFCGWTRKSAFPSLRFFMIPKEPGMKQMMWLHVLGKKELQPRDRVCSVHFEKGRPSNDPSHKDFVPHLYLNSEPPKEMISYIEELSEDRTKDALDSGSDPLMTRLGIRGGETTRREESEYTAQLDPSNPKRIHVTKTARPSILGRARKPIARHHNHPQAPADDRRGGSAMPTNIMGRRADSVDPSGRLNLHGGRGGGGEGALRAPEAPSAGFGAQNDGGRIQHPIDGGENEGQMMEGGPGGPGGHAPLGRRVKLQLLSREIVEATAVRPGQLVVIKRRISKKRPAPDDLHGLDAPPIHQSMRDDL